MSERYDANPNELNPTADRPHCGRYFVARGFIDVGDIVVDVACGTGYGTSILYPVAGYVYAIDKNDTFMTKWIREKVQFLHQDIEKIETLPQCDDVVCLETIEHLDDPQRFLDKAVVAARKRIIISSPNKETAGENEFHKSNVMLSVLEKLMSKYSDEWVQYQSFIQGLYYIAVFIKKGTKNV